MTFLFLVMMFGCGAKDTGGAGESDSLPDGNYDEVVPGDFSFSLEWDMYEKGSYDSKTGKLVKHFDTVNPPVRHEIDHTLSDEQMVHIFSLISSIHVFSYPDVYNPGNEYAISRMSLTLTVRFGEEVKTIKAEDIPMSFASEDDMGHLFLTTCKEIYDIVTGSEEWESLPNPLLSEL